jgi:hypothetical protein
MPLEPGGHLRAVNNDLVPCFLTLYLDQKFEKRLILGQMRVGPINPRRCCDSKHPEKNLPEASIVIDPYGNPPLPTGYGTEST